MHIRGIIFDLYGVLGLNGWQDFKTRHFDGRWDEWEPLRQLGYRVDAGKATVGDFVAALSTATGVPSDAIRYQFEHTRINTELLDYIRDELKPVCKIGLLSNASRHDIVESLFTPDQRNLFDAVVLSAHVGVNKPDVKMFNEIGNILELKPEECVFVDDRVHHLRSAEKLGMKAILYTENDSVIAELRRCIQK